jgi:hypothetical protein
MSKTEVVATISFLPTIKIQAFPKKRAFLVHHLSGVHDQKKIENHAD